MQQQARLYLFVTNEETKNLQRCTTQSINKMLVHKSQCRFGITSVHIVWPYFFLMLLLAKNKKVPLAFTNNMSDYVV